MRTAALITLVFLAGCRVPESLLLGVAPLETPQSTVRAMLTEKHTAPLRLQGTIVEKCPVSGCWFRLKDDSGTVLVDLKPAGLTAAEIPVGTKVMAVGTVQREGDVLRLRATGIRY